MTTDSLVAWAARNGLDQNTVMRRFNSHVFSGSAQAWADGRKKAAAAFGQKPLETRKTERREEQQAADAAALKAAEEEDKKRLDSAKLIVEDYYARGEKLKPKGASLVPIEEAADFEKRGRSAGRVVMDPPVVAEGGDILRSGRVAYYRGHQKAGASPSCRRAISSSRSTTATTTRSMAGRCST